MDAKATVDRLLREHGQTYADEAGIRLRNAPTPLYQLLVLSTLLSTRISAEIAVAAARELFAAGLRTPAAMADSDWQDRVDALVRGHYRRYDESTATTLGKSAQWCQERWHGDLRRLRRGAAGDPRALRRLLQEFAGIGPTGADIFAREVQVVWPEFAPFIDRKVRAGAAAKRLPTTPEELAGMVRPEDFGRLASALIRSQ